eukprot:4266896-Prymnesium_polylepis.1
MVCCCTFFTRERKPERAAAAASGPLEPVSESQVQLQVEGKTTPQTAVGHAAPGGAGHMHSEPKAPAPVAAAPACSQPRPAGNAPLASATFRRVPTS